MGTKLERIAEISATTPKPEFTSLYHLINAEMLMQCHKELDGSKAVGIDRVTKAEYEEHLEEKHNKSCGAVEEQGIQAFTILEGIYTKEQWENETAGDCFLRGQDCAACS